MESEYFIDVSLKSLSPQIGWDTYRSGCCGNQDSRAVNPSRSRQFGLRGKGMRSLNEYAYIWACAVFAEVCELMFVL